LRKIDTSGQLKQIIGKTAEFRGVQEEAIAAIVAGESPIVVVIAIRSGKSLLFMLLA
jgi:superfamily II DNA helicase RecQ